MDILIPKCYINPPSRGEKYNRNSYSRRSAKVSEYSSESVGYKFSTENLPTLVPDSIQVDLLNKSFKLNSTLFDIVDEINDSNYILNLEPGWGDNGKGITESTYLTAVEFLVNYSNFIYDSYRVSIVAPEINPVRNGSIDMVWNTGKAYMLVNIKPNNDQIVGTFFGFLKVNKKIKEGEIDLLNIEPAMALWMKDLI